MTASEKGLTDKLHWSTWLSGANCSYLATFTEWVIITW